MKKALHEVEKKFSAKEKLRPQTAIKNNAIKIENSDRSKGLFEYSRSKEKLNKSNLSLKSSDSIVNEDLNGVHKDSEKHKKFKLSLESINFESTQYGIYPDDTFQPSVYFWKFLCVRPEYETETKKKFKKLILNVPDTIVFNESEINYWMYTDLSGKVNRLDNFNDFDCIEKFRHNCTSKKDVMGVFKTPTYKDDLLDGNSIEVLNQEELEKHIYSKSSGACVIQRYIKCKGPKAFICRSVYKKQKQPYVFIFTNKMGYADLVLNQNLKFITNSKLKDSYYLFYSTSGKHLEETNFYMNNIVKFIENNTDVVIDELACDFIKDEAGVWWMINCKALKVKNIAKFINLKTKVQILQPNLIKFTSRIDIKYDSDEKKKFDYQTKLKCKFCGISYNKISLKYNLTCKMILETTNQLKQLNINLNYVERPDLSHTDSSMIYLSYRVCEDCFLMFETSNDIKHYQIKLANFFRINVDSVNFGVDYLKKDNDKNNIGVNSTLENKFSALINIEKEDENEKNEKNDKNKHKSNTSILKTTTINNNKDVKVPDNPNNLFRIMLIFSDIFWNPEVQVPEKELYLVYNFLGNFYKARVKAYYPELDYININYYKMYYIACDPNEGFIEYIDKNRSMKVRVGYFKELSEKEQNQKTEKMINTNNIQIEDSDICSESELDLFVKFADVDLDIQGLKYGDKYRNSLNGLLFKEDKPHYTGKLRCTIRINNVKPIDVSIYNFKKLLNFYIPPIHFITPEEVPDYWLEIIERQKLREVCLDKIIEVMNKEKLKYNKEKNKEQVFMALESLISFYLTKSIKK